MRSANDQKDRQIKDLQNQSIQAESAKRAHQEEIQRLKSQITELEKARAAAAAAAAKAEAASKERLRHNAELDDRAASKSPSRADAELEAKRAAEEQKKKE